MTAPTTDAGAGTGDAAGTTTPPAGGGSAFAPITSQADLDRNIGDRLARQRAQFGDVDALKAKAAKFDELEAASKTELQRLQEAAAADKARGDKAEAALLRHEVAVAKGIPAELADRLAGKTREEMEADADKLLGVIGNGQGGQGGGDPLRPVANLRPGALPASPAAGVSFDADTWIRRQAGVVA
jgi:hypothetical protein